jgi:hypothetical protein
VNASRWVVCGSRLFSRGSAVLVLRRKSRGDPARPKAAPLQARGDLTSHERANPLDNFEDEDVAPALSSRLLLKKTLFRRGLAKGIVTVEMRHLPAAEPFRFEHRTMIWILVVHSGKRFDKTRR